jgi:hypothetical protein
MQASRPDTRFFSFAKIQQTDIESLETGGTRYESTSTETRVQYNTEPDTVLMDSNFKWLRARGGRCFRAKEPLTPLLPRWRDTRRTGLPILAARPLSHRFPSRIGSPTLRERFVQCARSLVTPVITRDTRHQGHSKAWLSSRPWAFAQRRVFTVFRPDARRGTEGAMGLLH